MFEVLLFICSYSNNLCIFRLVLSVSHPSSSRSLAVEVLCSALVTSKGRRHEGLIGKYGFMGTQIYLPQKISFSSDCDRFTWKMQNVNSVKKKLLKYPGKMVALCTTPGWSYRHTVLTSDQYWSMAALYGVEPPTRTWKEPRMFSTSSWCGSALAVVSKTWR